MMSLLQHKKSMLPDKQEHAYSIMGTCFLVNRSMLFDPFQDSLSCFCFSM